MTSALKVQRLYPIFFLSGMSGLIYEVIWIRQFGNIFGNTIYSSSLVMAVFMLGLGSGGLAAGLWADARRPSTSRCIRIYGWLEVGIGFLGLLSALFLSFAERVSPIVSSYVTDQNGWSALTASSHLWRYLFAVALLLPITMAMGATLTILIRGLLSQKLSDSGWTIGKLYGANTAGAALGALAVDSLLVPNIGLWSSQLLAVLFNLVAAGAALKMAAAKSENTVVPPVKDTRAEKIVLPNSAIAMMLGIFLTGFVAMGAEVFWFRFLISVWGALRATLSTALAVVLIGIWLGSVEEAFSSVNTDTPRDYF